MQTLLFVITLESLDHQHLTTPDLKILQGMTLVEDKRELFSCKTLDTNVAHSSFSEKPYKNVLRVSFIY